MSEIEDVFERAVADSAKGCCADASWRGHYCQYHLGLEAGMESALHTLKVLGYQIEKPKTFTAPPRMYGGFS